MSYPRYAGLGAVAAQRIARRRGRFGFGAVAGPVMPTAGAQAVVDAALSAAYGTVSTVPWTLDADGSTVTLTTTGGQSVRFGFGRGTLTDFPPSLGIAGEVSAPVAALPIMPTVGAGSVMPTAGARAVVDAALSAAYGTVSTVPWTLDADGSTVTLITTGGQSVRFGFGRGTLTDFPPSVGIASGAAPPVTVQPPPVTYVQPVIIPSVPGASPYEAAQIIAASGSVAPASVPAEPQPVAPSMEAARAAVPVVTAAASVPAMSTGLLIALAVGAFLLLRKA